MDKAAQEIAIKEYKSSLSDLVVNSKPLIQMLSILADENSAFAPAIVDAIEKHLLQAPSNCKLPVLYLIDSICKTVKFNYAELFTTNLVTNFCAVFEKVDEKTRASMYKLRSTWGEIFPATKLYALDARVQNLDPAWPLAPLPVVSKVAKASSSIHVNPKFLQDPAKTAAAVAAAAIKAVPAEGDAKVQELLKRQSNLLRMQQQKVALELRATQDLLKNQNVLSVNVGAESAAAQALSVARAVKQLGQISSSSLMLKPSAAASKTVIRPATIPPPTRPNTLDAAVSVIAHNKDPRLARSGVSQKSSLPSAKDALEPRPEKLFSPDVTLHQTSPKPSKSSSKKESSHKRENGKSDARKSSKSSSSPKSSSSSPSKSHRSSKSSKKETKSSKKAAVPDGKFKDIKSVHRRNYMRKARSVSSSPEPPDVAKLKKEAATKVPKQNPEQDVDLRRLASPTSKKRGSTPEKGADQPSSPKRSKQQSEILDELFGSEDVDLRQLAAPVRAELKKAPDWARFKESVPDSYRSPLKNCNWENGSDISLSDIELGPPPPMPKIIIPEDAKVSPGGKKAEFDSLGRRLLHSNHSVDETRERRRSNSLSEDVDLRPMFNDMTECQETSEKISMMIAQAEEQLKNGTLNMQEYSALLKEVIQINEASKLREAQRRDEQENWGESSNWQDEDSQDSGKASPDDKTSKDEADRRHRKRDDARKHNDVDERYLQRRDFHHRGRGFQRRGGWTEGHVPRPQWEENNWNRPQGGPSRPPYMRGGPRGHFPRGGAGPQGDFAGPRFWPPGSQGPRPGQFPPSGFPPIHPGMRTGPKGADLPLPDPRDMELARLNYSRTLSIDGVARDIRHYGEHTIILMSWDDPRTISFYPGERRVQFESGQSVLCSLDGKYQDVIINGMVHKVKLGAPTRELNIDGKDHECYFGGTPVVVELNGINIRVQLEGPAPRVKIGEERRMDYCAGKINLVIDAVHMVPVFLDATPQIIHVGGVPLVIKFIEAFKRVSINGQKYAFEYGGLPQQIFVNNQRHYIGFTSLPPSVRPGYITIVNMEGGRLPSPPREDMLPPLIPEKALPPAGDNNSPALPMLGGSTKTKKVEKTTSAPEPRKVPLSRSILNTKPQLDVLTNLIPDSPIAAPTGFNYQMHQEKSQDQPSDSVPAVAPDLAELLAKLNDYGILQSVNATEVKKKEVEVKKEEVYRPVTFKSESLKTRQVGAYSGLYCGIQCSTCGLRFPPEQTLKYSQHLDWHFRQNRREKDSAKKAQSRKWYYDVSDWIQFEEIEDLEERAQSWFETQEEDKPEEVETEIPTVLAGENNTCEVCQENFEQFYNNEKDEWHFRDAIRVEDKVYHPHCYQDVSNVLDATTDSAAPEENGDDAVPKDEEMKPVTETEEEEKEEKPGKEEDHNEKPAEETEQTKVEPTEESEPMETDAKEASPEEESAEQTEVKVKEEPMEADSETAPTDEQNKDSGVFSQESESAPDVDVKIKEEPLEAEEEEEPVTQTLTEVDTTKNEVKSSIDGNVELQEAPLTAPVSLGKIKINITTPAPAPVEPAPKVEEEPETPSEELEEPLRRPQPKDEDFELKPKLRGRKLQEMPPVNKGREDSALCTIM